MTKILPYAPLNKPKRSPLQACSLVKAFSGSKTFMLDHSASLLWSLWSRKQFHTSAELRLAELITLHSQTAIVFPFQAFKNSPGNRFVMQERGKKLDQLKWELHRMSQYEVFVDPDK